jgi:hypothetical protein
VLDRPRVGGVYKRFRVEYWTIPQALVESFFHGV